MAVLRSTRTVSRPTPARAPSRVEALGTAGAAVRLPGHTLLDSEDIDETVSVATTVLTEHRLLLQKPVERFHALIQDCFVGDLRLAYFRYGAPFTVRLSRPLGHYAVNFTLHGLSRTRHGGGSAAAGVGQATAFSARYASEMSWTPETEVLSLVVPRTALEAHFRRMSGVGVGEITFEPHVDISGAHMLRSSIKAALRVTDGGRAPLPEELVWQLRDAILTAMLVDLDHDRVNALARSLPSSQSRLCEAATTVMRRRVSVPTPIPEVATMLGVSERSLEAAFREELGSTPSGWFKRLRLQAVHEALLARRADETTVGQTAAGIGAFFHHGRFAKEYLAVFGERPSDTLRRSRS